MIQIKKILVPTDFSDHAHKALHYALELARTYRSELVLLHAMEAPIYPVSFGVGPTDLPQLEQDMRRKIQELLDQMRAEVAGQKIAARTMLRDGPPFVEIVKAAREEKVDLIVIATHGRTGIKHALLGSTAEKVVRKAPCPVLTVREGEREFVLP